jgi:hypothetical protein
MTESPVTELTHELTEAAWDAMIDTNLKGVGRWPEPSFL